MLPLVISSELLDGRYSFSAIANYISEYFYQKFGDKYNLSYEDIDRITGNNECIPEKIYHKIDNPNNTDAENNFLIDVYCGILDFAVDLEQYRNIDIHQQINLVLSTSNLLNIQDWNEDLLPLLQNHPLISSKISSVLSSFLIQAELKFEHSFLLLDINTDLEDYKLFKPLQQILINTYLNSINDPIKSAIHLKKSLNPDKNHTHLIEPFSSFFKFDCSTLINERQRINDNEIRVHFEFPLGIKLSFSEFIEKLQKFLSFFNALNFKQHYLIPEQKFLDGSKISILSPLGNEKFSSSEFQFILKIEHENPSLSFSISEEISLHFFDFVRLSLDKHEVTKDGFINYINNDSRKTKIITTDSFYYTTSILNFFNENKCQNIRALMLHHTLSIDEHHDNIKSHTRVKI